LTGPEAVSLFDDVTALRAQYPERKSAVMPALHLAQERHGWLPPDALREIAEALDLTPAYVQAVASFYDMYHLEPTGRHEVAVCTNVSCALVGAQAVVEAFEETLGITTGETTEDGEFVLRSFECLGGCGWAPVVAVDWRYLHHVKPEDVPEIVEAARRGGERPDAG
jgi:NADH-quinone oxidoreductase subunit E